jgi:hypothetical protein
VHAIAGRGKSWRSREDSEDKGSECVSHPEHDERHKIFVKLCIERTLPIAAIRFSGKAVARETPFPIALFQILPPEVTMAGYGR